MAVKLKRQSSGFVVAVGTELCRERGYIEDGELTGEWYFRPRIDPESRELVYELPDEPGHSASAVKLQYDSYPEIAVDIDYLRHRGYVDGTSLTGEYHVFRHYDADDGLLRLYLPEPEPAKERERVEAD